MFSSQKILQEIGYLLSLNDGKMNLLKLIKELYLIDRLSIAERDTSVSGDVYFSLPHGPILSATLNMLYDLPKSSDNPWSAYLKSEDAQYYPDIILSAKTADDRLSEKDKEYVRTISKQFKQYTKEQIEKYSHKLPEWKDPQGSSQKIRFQDIMFALGKTTDEIAEAKAEYDSMSNLDNRLAINT
jgi:hypothetical protein